MRFNQSYSESTSSSQYIIVRRCYVSTVENVFQCWESQSSRMLTSRKDKDQPALLIIRQKNGCLNVNTDAYLVISTRPQRKALCKTFQEHLGHAQFPRRTRFSSLSAKWNVYPHITVMIHQLVYVTHQYIMLSVASSWTMLLSICCLRMAMNEHRMTNAI